jgi:hypothetical protein
MNRTLLAGGCSFTFGHELSDDNKGQKPSNNSWSALLAKEAGTNYICVARAGLGNAGIARRIFEYIVNNSAENVFVTAMWSFSSRYDWGMPRNAVLERTRWATITPWDTSDKQAEVQKLLSSSEPQLEIWKTRRENMKDTGVGPFADALYRYAANQYHETYLSWKSIVWLQNILEKKKIPYLFTLADNTLFWEEFTPLKETDNLMTGLYNEIDFDRWFVFGERQMGFNQWASLNDYPRGTTHPLDFAHEDAAKLMKDKFLELYNKQQEQL